MFGIWKLTKKRLLGNVFNKHTPQDSSRGFRFYLFEWVWMNLDVVVFLLIFSIVVWSFKAACFHGSCNTYYFNTHNNYFKKFSFFNSLHLFEMSFFDPLFFCEGNHPNQISFLSMRVQELFNATFTAQGYQQINGFICIYAGILRPQQLSALQFPKKIFFLASSSSHKVSLHFSLHIYGTCNTFFVKCKFIFLHFIVEKLAFLSIKFV